MFAQSRLSVLGVSDISCLYLSVAAGSCMKVCCKE